MKKNILLAILLLYIFPNISKAIIHDSIFSVYKNNEFISLCQFKVKASDSIANTVIINFNRQLKTNANSLFSWAFKGLKFQGEKDGLMSFNFKSSSFDKEAQVVSCVGDVSIPYLITIPNIKVDCKLSKTKHQNSKDTYYTNLVYSNTFLKDLKGILEIKVDNNNECWYVLETHISFGKFFDFFITENRYKEIAEWRLKKFILNLKDEAERRAKIASTTKRALKN